MKRANGYILGTILVVLIAGVVVLQALNQSNVEEAPNQGQGYDQHEAQAGQPPEPTVDELDSSISQGAQVSPVQGAAGRIPDSEKFKPIDNTSTDPTNRWWDGSPAEPAGN